MRQARAALAHYADFGQWIDLWPWSLAARTAHDLGDTEAVRGLLALVESAAPGQLTPRLRAEHELARARLAASEAGQSAAASFAGAISVVREHGTPYDLAHGLLDHAAYLIHLGDTEAAETAITEARTIAGCLRCQPLLDRAADLTPARPPVQA